MKKMLLWEDKSFYRTIVAIAIPIAMQNLINFGVSMMDTLMIGLVGEVQLSAASMANQFTFLYMVVSFGFISGCSVLTAQYWGRGDTYMIKKIMSFLYMAITVMGIGFTLFAFFFPETVMRIYIPDDAEVIAEGTKYLKIVAFTFVLSSFANATIGILRSVGTVNISVYVYSISLVVNTFLNWVLIFGNLGMPTLGIEGAAIATLISRIIEVLIIAYYIFYRDSKLRLTVKELLSTNMEVVKSFLKYGTPVLGNEILWSTGNTFVMMIIGRMGREFVAANSIAGVLFQLGGIAVFGLSNASSTIIGNTIGAGDYEDARLRGNALMALSAIAGVVGALFMLVLRYPLIEVYNLSELAREYSYTLTFMVALMHTFNTVQMVIMMGILRGGGDTKFVMIYDVIFVWLICIPLGAVVGLWLSWPIALVYLVLKIDGVLKCIVSVPRVLKGKWVIDITQG